MGSTRAVVVAFMVGGIVGVLCDQIHVHYGVLYYASPWLWGQAWWVLPLFGATTVGVLHGAKLFMRASIGEHELYGSAAWFFAAYWASGMWHGHPYGLAVCYALFLALRTTHGVTWLFGLGIAAGGVLVEWLLTSLGLFTYRHPDLLGLPLWLPGLYAHSAPFALSLALRLRRP